MRKPKTPLERVALFIMQMGLILLLFICLVLHMPVQADLKWLWVFGSTYVSLGFGAFWVSRTWRKDW